ncbi:MAG: hypothetical protein A3K06_03675 [Candidatus Doudnabacteria bacterium RIFCSPHIGHO2_01_52_17]|uniref:PrgI family protein n=1 Tax=Candidatus Doudnabacteria bacterium RIFCSPHIGHO2_01_52_17 TaxID=1817820 RepID=A0A1F5N8V1_9BACT|nr:MAG: hypothetical protein A3K06_03675 [Candidatus Doudnabacteria bacterium RIFCSPHIGHO2_01_52_17]
MKYSVPQFIDVEDKLIGGLTLKQFLFIMAGGLLTLGIWSIFKFSFIFFLFGLPIAFASLAMAFGKFNGRPVMSNIPAIVRFFSTPRDRIFARTGDPTALMVKQAQTETRHVATPEETSAVASRLKKLSYLLDQKTAEEERLIHSGEMKGKWLSQI